MYSDNLREAARMGNLSAISSLVQKAFTTCEVDVDAEMQFGVTLWLKLKSDKNLDSQICLNVISRELDNLKPQKITSVRISETSSENSQQQVWNKYLALKQGKFVDNTKTVNQTAYVVCGVFALCLLLGIFTYKSPSTTSLTTSASSTSTSFSLTESRTFSAEAKQDMSFGLMEAASMSKG